MPSKIAKFMIAVTFAAVLVVPFFNIATGVAGQQSVVNESVTADVGNYVELQGYDVVDNETVYWNNSTTGNYEVLSEGTDYDFRYSEGSIKALSGGSVNDGDELLATYQYQATDAITETVILLAPLFLVLLILAAFGGEIDSMMGLGGY